MKNRAKILAAVVLFLTVSGFFLPEFTAWLSDVKMEQETVTVRDEHKELPLAHEDNLLDILGEAGTMKESAELRSGEYMDGKTAQKHTTSIQLLSLMQEYTEISDSCIPLGGELH